MFDSDQHQKYNHFNNYPTATFDAVGTCRAFAKVLAIQGDFISKHYLHKPETVTT